MQILGGENWAIWEKERKCRFSHKESCLYDSKKKKTMYITLMNSVTISLNILHFNVFLTFIYLLFIIYYYGDDMI